MTINLFRIKFQSLPFGLNNLIPLGFFLFLMKIFEIVAETGEVATNILIPYQRESIKFHIIP